MSRPLPLPALLSGAVVALTIELDNAVERGFEHRTTWARGEQRRGPWLVSIVMWANCLRYIGEDGTTVAEVQRRARTPTNLDGVRRWGYVTVDGQGRGRAYQVGRATPGSVLRLTEVGRAACAHWEPLPGEIEKRWRTRFGAQAIDRLRAALLDVVTRVSQDLPDCLPILGPGLFSRRQEPPRRALERDSARDDGRLALWSLLSRVLLTFALDYEREAVLSLAVMADVLRSLEPSGIAVAQLPRITGVSKEAIAMALTLIQRGGLAEIRTVNRRRIVGLTSRGAKARGTGLQRIDGVESAWRRRFGAAAIDALRVVLEPLAGDLTRGGSPLFAGLDPHPDGWRAQAPAPQTLPWFPMVLHRGGWPDGS